jgi:hypothetical protein
MTYEIDRILKRVEVMLEAAVYRSAIKLVRLALEDELGLQLAVAAPQAALQPARRIAPVPAPKPMPAPAPTDPRIPIEIEPGVFRASDGRGYDEWWAPSEHVREHLPLWIVKRVTLNNGKQVYWTFTLKNEKRGELTMRFLRNATTVGRRWDEVLAVCMLRLGVPKVTNSDQFIGKSIRLSPDKCLLQSADAIAKAMEYCLDCGC